MAILLDRENLLAQIAQHRLAFQLLQKFFQEIDPEFRYRHQRLHPHAPYPEFVDLVLEHVRVVGLAGQVTDREALGLRNQEFDQSGYVGVGADIQDILVRPQVHDVEPGIDRSYDVAVLTLTPDGWLATGDLACVDEQARVRLVGREKELIPWSGGWLLDPQHLSNLVTRSIAVKDAMVVHTQPGDRRLSAYVFPDWPRIRKDVRWRRDIAAGLTEDQALKPHLVEAIRYAASLLAIPAELDTRRIWILPRKLERTPTHKIKYSLELSRLHEARAI
jgi:acyl-CoA synthetase (AMP-forming)/AMP-acid ligase II